MKTLILTCLFSSVCLADCNTTLEVDNTIQVYCDSKEEYNDYKQNIETNMLNDGIIDEVNV